MSNMDIYANCTVLQDYMVNSGVSSWSSSTRFRVYYKGERVSSVTENLDSTFTIQTNNKLLHKNVSSNLDEVLYVEEITVRQRHNGIRSTPPEKRT